MWIVRVKDRGRDLAMHVAESRVDAQEIARVYVVLGYLPERVTVEHQAEGSQAA
jgi:hypothetical protein